MTRVFKVGETVRIAREAKGSINEFAKVTMIGTGELEGKYHVSAISMPYAGTICKFVNAEEMEKV